MRTKLLALIVTTFCLAAALVSAQTAPQAPAPKTPVVALQNLAHTTETLEKTVPFYRDVLGLPVNGADPLKATPTVLNEPLSRFTATKGASFRAATFRIPNAPFGFELTEFTGVPRKNARPNIQDIGVATLALQVRNMDAIYARLKAAGATIVTVGGAPMSPANTKTRSIVVRDPDGFFLEIIQPDPLPASAASTQGDILGGAVQLSIEDSEKSAAFFRDAIGFVVPRAAGAFATNASVANLINLQGAQWRITHGSIAGTTLDFGLIEYKGVPRNKFVLGAEDPGSPAFTMVVGNIDAAVAQWKSAGGTVVSTGGEAVKQPNGSGNVFVRDVNGFMWELIQRASAPQR